MKKIRVPLFYLAFVAICFAACTSKEKDETAQTPILRDTIKVAVAEQYIANYGPHAGKAIAIIDTVINGKRVKLEVESPNSRAIWFSLTQLRAFVKKLEKDEGDGVRFYFATYNKNYPDSVKDKPKKEYWGHNTLVMVATRPDTIGDRPIHKDFFVATGGFKPRFKLDKPGGFIVGNPPENRGEMCPPPKACDSTGAMLIDPSKPVQ